MKTLKELIEDIGKVGYVHIQAPKGISVKVEILDIKQSYGKTRWLVKPISGEGQCWVEEVEIIG